MAYYLVTNTHGEFDIIKKKNRRVTLLASSTNVIKFKRYSNQRESSLIYINKDWDRKENLIRKDQFPLYVSSCVYTSDYFLSILKGTNHA